MFMLKDEKFIVRGDRLVAPTLDGSPCGCCDDDPDPFVCGTGVTGWHPTKSKDLVVEDYVGYSEFDPGPPRLEIGLPDLDALDGSAGGTWFWEADETPVNFNPARYMIDSDVAIMNAAARQYMDDYDANVLPLDETRTGRIGVWTPKIILTRRYDLLTDHTSWLWDVKFGFDVEISHDFTGVVRFFGGVDNAGSAGCYHEDGNIPVQSSTVVALAVAAINQWINPYGTSASLV